MVPIVVVKILIALALDQWLGEPRRWHPLVGFGRLATWLESRLNLVPSARSSIAGGLLAWLLAVVPFVIATAWVVQYLAQTLSQTYAGVLFEVILLYLAIGRKSLFQHSQRVYEALRNNDLNNARNQTSMIVSRDCKQLDANGCARAATESVLENGSDSVYGALFWFAMLGAPGVVLYRLANTLDAMWGYRTPRLRWFGATAARLDDLLNLIPARLCALCYSFAGNTGVALNCWRQYAHRLSSPNGGPVMCAGAGALNVRLGGPATYQGIELDKPYFGGTQACKPGHIVQANRLLDRSLLICIAFTALGELGYHWLSAGALH